MKYSSFLKSPKKEEQEVPDTIVTQLSKGTKDAYINDEELFDAMDEFGGFMDIEEETNLSKDKVYGQLSWDFIDWVEGRPIGDDDDEVETKIDDRGNFFEEEDYYKGMVIKSQTSFGFWDGDERKVSLNLNLNYQEVLDAWSDRGTLWADDCSVSMASNGYYMGEVPVMEEERTRREASVLRYKEKRQTRLFSKKIRYQVRKLNADKRPRLKGRFVKRVSR